jgi:predicted transcriptional regulator
MRSQRRTDALVPPDLAAAIKATAEEEHREPGEVVREAYERYVDDREWQKLLAYGRERARTLGLTEADVPRLIAEVRQERRKEGGKAAE